MKVSYIINVRTINKGVNMNFVIGDRVRCFQSKYRKDLIGLEGVITNLAPSGWGKFIVDVKLDNGENRKFHNSQIVLVV